MMFHRYGETVLKCENILNCGGFTFIIYFTRTVKEVLTVKLMNYESILEDMIKRIPIINNYEIANDTVQLTIQDYRQITLKIIKANLGYPKEIEGIIRDYKSDNYCVILAPYISEMTADICIKENFGFIDLSGNCHISTDSLYIEIKGNKNEYKQKRALKSIYEKSAVVSSVILRTMLSDTNKVWKQIDLAKEANCSIGQVSKVKKFLFNQSLLTQKEDGIMISDPRTLMRKWAQTYNSVEDEKIGCYSLDSIPNIEEKIAKMKDEIGIDCILTGFAGGSRYQPVVRYQRVHALIDYKDIDKAIDYLGLKKVDTGANVVFIIQYHECVALYSNKINNNLVASPVQLYLDSMSIKGRGEELAETILEREICK